MVILLLMGSQIRINLFKVISPSTLVIIRGSVPLIILPIPSMQSTVFALHTEFPRKDVVLCVELWAVFQLQFVPRVVNRLDLVVRSIVFNSTS